MQTILSIGLLLSLFGVLLLQLAFKLLRIEPLSGRARLVFWLLAICALALAAHGSELWLQQIGAQTPTAPQIGMAILASIVMLAIWPVAQRLQTAAGGSSVAQTEQFVKLANFSFSFRLFLVITAAVVEEILYRGYAIGIGKDMLDSTVLAASVSLTAFIIAHFRWGLSHLFSVFWSGLILTFLFVVTNNMIICILVHAAVDAVGLLVLPMAIRRKRSGTDASSQKD